MSMFLFYLKVFTHVIEVRRTLCLVEDPRHDEDPRRPGVLPEHVGLPVEIMVGLEPPSFTSHILKYFKFVAITTCWKRHFFFFEE